MIVALAMSMLVCSVVPAALFVRNLWLYREPPAAGAGCAVSILIPARNEASGIAAAVRAALASRDAAVEVIVMDDSSTDATAEIVRGLAAEDARVRLECAPALPRGWNGKQHACWALAHAASAPVLCFVDADVRLAPDCVARMAALLERNGNALVSGFPRQVTGTWMEWMLLPLIHFVLLGFLPLRAMRKGTDPAFAAGCGQFMMVRREAYFACGGHSGIKLTMHDGLLLPRLFRAHGLRTDLADLTALATCRMYTNARQVWDGLAKNATEGMATPGRIVPISAVLVLGQILPFVLALALLLEAGSAWVYLVHHAYIFGITAAGKVFLLSGLASVLLDWGIRLVAARRFRQDWRSAVLHPVGILLLLAIQWYALVRKISGRAVSWRDRAYQES